MVLPHPRRALRLRELISLPMPNARRFALSALLLGGSAVLAALVAVSSTPRHAGARVPAAAELPWPTRAAVSDRRLPFLLLYVDSHCEHCSRAAILVDSVVTARGLRAVMVSDDAPADADAYQHRLGLHLRIETDSASALLHAIATRAVPTLVLFHADGSRELVVGFTRDAPYRATLAGFSQ